jgi:hypothetical protein
MIYLALLLLTVVFIEMFMLCGVNHSVKRMLHISQCAYSTIMSADLDEEQKEKSVRRASLDMLKTTLAFLLKVSVVMLTLIISYLMLSFAFTFSEDRLMEMALLPRTIIALAVTGYLYIRLRNVIIRQLQSR